MVSDILSGLLADEQCSCGTGVQEPAFMTVEPAPTKKHYRQKGPSHVSFAERLGRGRSADHWLWKHPYSESRALWKGSEQRVADEHSRGF